MSLKLEEAPSGNEIHRGKGRGGNFMVLGRENLLTLIKAPTSNRMNFILVYIVLLAGTGADHKYTKWSAKACEEKLGIGRPRAKLAIAELVKSGLVSLAPNFDARRPQYILTPPSTDIDEIFLPVALVTGLVDEASILRRVKETNDPLIIKILLSIYRDAILDRTYSLPVATLSSSHDDDYEAATKVIGTGIFNLWHLPRPTIQRVDRTWVHSIFGVKETTSEMFQDFWSALKTLQNLGAITIEDWVFDSNSPNAEPLFPVDFEGIYDTTESKAASLTSLLWSTAFNFVEDKEYILEKYDGGLFIPLPSHCSAPAIRGVVKLRIEPDSPGRRMSYALRMRALEYFTATFEKASQDFSSRSFNRPFTLLVPESTE